MSPQSRHGSFALAFLLLIASVSACNSVTRGSEPVRSPGAANDASVGLPAGPVTQAQVLRGRALAVNRDCGACHGGNPNPAAKGWLAGKSADDDAETVGPFRAWPRNLTPDDDTGLGRVSARQIFNALRYGLRPNMTPDVEITSATPGQGNHPTNPDYLSPAMPWLNWRYMADDELWAIAAYLKHGLRPVSHRIPPSQSPPDHWASEFTVEKVGTHLLPPFPAKHEQLGNPSRREQMLQGRTLVASIGCSACHGGAVHPDQDGWLSGTSMGQADLDMFDIGPFKTYPRNLTSDNATGIGRFSERQIFNALRYGLRPGDTPDIEITSSMPGQGNHPQHPKYLAPPMVWPSVRHMTDEQLKAIAAYLKLGIKPVRNRVQDSEG
ncbi:MAG: c-type cytochrome, partial [Pseudomonadota bacterium]|nr:c-type cytochrome [Pseudomonadota bacterium]